MGSGAREHALAWRLSSSPNVDAVWVAPGNAGTAQLATNVPVSPTDVPAITKLAQEVPADLVVVGPEQPLVDGLVDRLTELGIPAFGPSAAAARLEASKSFARQVMIDAGVPSPDYRVFHDPASALDFLANHSAPIVVKADGLAAGKGVALCATRDEAVAAVGACMEDRLFGAAGDTIVLEEWLRGTEVSVFAFCDGENLSAPAAACDYKAVGDGDMGPNTGGMGSFAVPPFWNPSLADQVSDMILKPTVARLAELGCPYRGMLYAGLMLTAEGPKVLEFNCRFGDPETQVIVPQLESDLVEAMYGCIEGNLTRTPVRWGSRAHVGVVMASGGYPDAYETGKRISGLEDSSEEDVLVFHAGTACETGQAGHPVTVTSGGRVLTVVGRGDILEEARRAAYRRVSGIHFEGAFCRQDIGDLSAGDRSGR